MTQQLDRKKKLQLTVQNVSSSEFWQWSQWDINLLVWNVKQLKRFHSDGRRSSNISAVVMCSESRECSLEREWRSLCHHASNWTRTFLQRITWLLVWSYTDGVLKFSSLYKFGSLWRTVSSFFFEQIYVRVQHPGPQLFLTELPVCSDTFCLHV